MKARPFSLTRFESRIDDHLLGSAGCSRPLLAQPRVISCNWAAMGVLPSNHPEIGSPLSAPFFLALP